MATNLISPDKARIPHRKPELTALLPSRRQVGQAAEDVIGAPHQLCEGSGEGVWNEGQFLPALSTGCLARAAAPLTNVHISRPSSSGRKQHLAPSLSVDEQISYLKWKAELRAYN